MSNELAGVTNRSIRDGFGDRAFTAGQLAIDGTNVENVETTVAVTHTINGVFQTAFAVDSEIDLSALAVINAKNGDVLSAAGAASAAFSHPALAAGDDTQTLVYLLACKGNVAYIIEPTVDVAAAQDNADYSLSCPAGYAAFGLIKIVQAPTASVGVAAFKLGVDDLTGITGRTSTFFDVSAVPATIADIVEV